MPLAIHIVHLTFVTRKKKKTISCILHCQKLRHEIKCKKKRKEKEYYSKRSERKNNLIQRIHNCTCLMNKWLWKSF